MVFNYFNGMVFWCVLISYVAPLLIGFAYLRAKKLPTPAYRLVWILFIGLVISGFISFIEGIESGVYFRAIFIGILSSMLFSSLLFGSNILIALKFFLLLINTCMPNISKDIIEELAKLEKKEV